MDAPNEIIIIMFIQERHSGFRIPEVPLRQPLLIRGWAQGADRPSGLGSPVGQLQPQGIANIV
jgi:hypothetical protein